MVWARLVNGHSKRCVRKMSTLSVGTHRQAPLEGHEATHHERCHEAHQDGHPDEWDEGGRDRDGSCVGLCVPLALAHQAGELAVFSDVALDGGDASEIVDEADANCARLLAHLRVERLRAALVVKCPDQNHRNRQHGEQRNARGEIHEHEPYQQSRGGDLDQRVGAAIEKALELVDVVVQDGDETTAAPILEVRHLQLLHVSVGLRAQLVLNRLRQVSPEHVVQVLEHRLTHPDEEGEGTEQHELRFDVVHAEPGERRLILPYHRVDSHADQDLRRDVEDLVEYRAESRQPDLANERDVPSSSGVGEWTAADLAAQRSGEASGSTPRESSWARRLAVQASGCCHRCARPAGAAASGARNGLRT